jgi:adenine-specific DNA-methyltransferase
MARNTSTQHTPVATYTHETTRINIPTEELRDFVAQDEQTPPTMQYLRDPSLDPQLVWRGKDEQDQQPLVVDNVPIYIQETIDPRVLIDDLRRNGAASAQPSLYADFNRTSFEECIDFYRHEQSWTNRMILAIRCR